MGCEDSSHYYIRYLQTSSPTLVIIQYWEGNAAIEDIDRTGVNPRFMAMYAVDDEKAGCHQGHPPASGGNQ